MKMFKNKKTRYRNLSLIVVPLIVVMLLFGWLAYDGVFGYIETPEDTGPSTPANSIPEMDYHLSDDATDLQKELFAELKGLIDGEATDAEIAASIAENYVADFYTWSNKESLYDIGGMYYIYSPNKNGAYLDARDHFYKYLDYYIETYGRDEILEVDSVTSVVDSATKTYTINSENYDMYEVTVDWTYKDTELTNDVDFEKRLYFKVYINDDGRFEIVEMFGDR